VETLARPNGDTLFYDPRANVFAVADRDGLPKTMFKPDNGGAYWQEQKDRGAKRQTARRNGGGDEG
jgi:pyocin large subunit-like protein